MTEHNPDTCTTPTVITITVTRTPTNPDNDYECATELHIHTLSEARAAITALDEARRHLTRGVAGHLIEELLDLGQELADTDNLDDTITRILGGDIMTTLAAIVVVIAAGVAVTAILRHTERHR